MVYHGQVPCSEHRNDPIEIQVLHPAEESEAAAEKAGREGQAHLWESNCPLVEVPGSKVCPQMSGCLTTHSYVIICVQHIWSNTGVDEVNKHLMRPYLWPGFPVGIFPQKIAGLGHLWFGLMIPEVFPCQLSVGVLNRNLSKDSMTTLAINPATSVASADFWPFYTRNIQKSYFGCISRCTAGQYPPQQSTSKWGKSPSYGTSNPEPAVRRKMCGWQWSIPCIRTIVPSRHWNDWKWTGASILKWPYSRLVNYHTIIILITIILLVNYHSH